MGHSVLVCDVCSRQVMESRNSWECDCGAVCNASTKWTFVIPVGFIKPPHKRAEIAPDDSLFHWSA